MTSRAGAPGRTDVVVRQAGELCEGPLWDARIGALVWVDIPLGLVHRLDVATGADVVVRDVGAPGRLRRAAPVGRLRRRDRARRRRGRRRLARPRRDQRPARSTAAHPHERRGLRPVGSLLGRHDVLRRPAGSRCAFYRLAPDRTVNQVLDNVSVSNGIDWAPDASAMYYADSATGRVDVFDVDRDDGQVTTRRALLEIELPGGEPGRAHCRRRGLPWVALWDERPGPALFAGRATRPRGAAAGRPADQCGVRWPEP